MAERAACSPAPAAALVGGSDGGRSGRGGDLGRISKPPRLGQIRAHSSVSTAWRATCFRHHLKQMFSLDLAPWYFPFMRSVQALGGLAGPSGTEDLPRVPSAQVEARGSPLPGDCVAARGEVEGPDAPDREAGREAGGRSTYCAQAEKSSLQGF